MTLLKADAISLPLADESVDLVVTSPPYFALRSYTDGGEHYDGQIGSEDSPQAFLEALWAVTAECRRVLKPTGSLWVNLGDKYAGSGGHNNSGIAKPHTGSITFAGQAKNAALGDQWLDAGYPQFGGFLYQPIHAVVGGHTHGQVHRHGGLAPDGAVGAHLDLYVAATHVGNGGIKLPSLVGDAMPGVEQGDGVTRLKAQDLDMARRTAGQFELGIAHQRGMAVKARHRDLL